MSNDTLVQIEDVGVAKTLIETAQKQNVFQGEVPTDEAEILSRANELYRLAKQAQNAGMDAPPVLAVIGIAENAPSSDDSSAQSAPTSAPSAPPPPAPPAPPAPSAAPAMVKIKDANGTVYEVQSDQVSSYTDSGAYSLVDENPAPPPPPPAPPAPTPIVPAPDEKPEPDPEPEPIAATGGDVDPSQYATVEPWEGYSSMNIPPLVKHIEELFKQKSGDEIKTLLAHVWEYETNNKDRQRLLGKLETLAKEGVTVSTSAPEAVEEAPAPAPVEVPPVANEGTDVRPEPPFAPAAPVVEAVPPAPPVEAPPVAPAQVEGQSDGLAQPLDGATQRSQQAIIAENLPIPPEFHGEPPVLPADFTTLSDQQIAQYSSQFNACLARANWLTAVAEGHAADAKIVAEGLMREYKASNPAPKGTTVDQIEANAVAAVPEISAAKKVQSDWACHGKLLHSLAGTYQSNCERLSREQTRRSDERNSIR